MMEIIGFLKELNDGVRVMPIGKDKKAAVSLLYMKAAIAEQICSDWDFDRVVKQIEKVKSRVYGSERDVLSNPLPESLVFPLVVWLLRYMEDLSR
jgi:hypothetical protein